VPILNATDKNISPIWRTNFRWEKLDFGITVSYRKRHIYIIWKTW
jgi:hypothetical protein